MTVNIFDFELEEAIFKDEKIHKNIKENLSRIYVLYTNNIKEISNNSEKNKHNEIDYDYDVAQNILWNNINDYITQGKSIEEQVKNFVRLYSGVVGVDISINSVYIELASEIYTKMINNS